MYIFYFSPNLSTAEVNESLARISKNINKNGNDQAENVVTNSALSPIEKKIRNLEKKLQQIDSLKIKQQKGEKLESTQVRAYYDFVSLFFGIHWMPLKSVNQLRRKRFADLCLNEMLSVCFIDHKDQLRRVGEKGNWRNERGISFCFNY